MANPAYRSDIDGLRAIAVLAILFFHLNERWMPGGFVGVDIFFVISGFLISSILSREISNKTFSFREFYRRRVRRIVPAYLATVAVTLLVGMRVLLPGDLSALGRSILWSLFAAPNIYFWRHLDTSYFAPASNQIPLLHLWSLGVEEQFYLFWPMLLLILMPRLRSKALGTVVVAIIFGSFVWGEYSASSSISFAYYMLPTRAGELLLGALVALMAPRRLGLTAQKSSFLFEVLAGLGFLMIGYAVLYLNSKTKFPGLHALIPSFGAALVILAGCFRRCRTAVFLSLKPVVFVGLISYSLYLWHWPVLAFMRYAYVDLSIAQQMCSLIVILILTVLSYSFVETPFRKMRLNRKEIQTYIALPAVVVLALSLSVKNSRLIRNAVAGQAFEKSEKDINALTDPEAVFEHDCQQTGFEKSVLDDEKCVINPSQRKNAARVLLWGDSNAAHFIGVLSAIARDKGFSFRNATVSSCPPVFSDNGDYGEIQWRDACSRFRATIQDRLKDYDTFLMGALWGAYERVPSFKSDLERTVKTITDKGKKVVLFAEIPQFPKYDRACELKKIRMPFLDCRSRSDYADSGEVEVNRYLRSLALRMKNVTYFDLRGMICRNQKCSPYYDNRPVYYDNCHLSKYGSDTIGAAMVRTNYELPPVFDKLR